MQEFLWIKPSVRTIDRRQVTLILVTNCFNVGGPEAGFYSKWKGVHFYTGNTVEGNENYADSIKERVARPQESVRSDKNCGTNGYKTHLETISRGVIVL